MGIRIIDPLPLYPFCFPVPVQQIVRIADTMPSFAEHGAMPVFIDQPCRLLHILGALYLHAGQHFRLRNIRRDNLCQGKQLLLHHMDRILLHKSGTAGRYHNRIQNHMPCPILTQLSGYCPHNFTGRQHSDLNRIRNNIRKNAIQLSCQKIRSNLHNSIDARCILGSQSGNRAHGIYAVHGHCLNIRLNTCPSAGIASRNCQRCSHPSPPFSPFISSKSRFAAAVLSPAANSALITATPSMPVPASSLIFFS